MFVVAGQCDFRGVNDCPLGDRNREGEEIDRSLLSVDAWQTAKVAGVCGSLQGNSFLSCLTPQTALLISLM